MLTQLRLAGALRGLRGVLLGSFVDCAAGKGPAPELVVAERLRELGVPIAAGAPIGHGTHNRPVRLGATALLDADGCCLEFPTE
jgi:muramoyltetrapeptide carboxypeptidase